MQNKIGNIKMSLPAEYQLPDEYDIVSCKECGFCYADTSASAEDYDRYYQNINYYYNKKEDGQYDAMLNKWANIVELYAEKDACILDMGFGNGRLLCELRERGFTNLYGIDTTKEGVKQLKAKGISAEYGSIYNKPSESMKGKFDIMLMIGVLEHLLEPGEALENAKKYLKWDGRLIVLVPNMYNLINSDLPVSYFFHQEHINYFTDVTLRLFMSLEGFSEEGLYSEFDGYGNLVGIYRNNGVIKRDQFGQVALQQYMKKQEQRDIRRETVIEKLLCSKEPLIIWGCGSLLLRLWAETRLKEANIIKIVDGNPTKINYMKLEGYKISSPQSLVDEKTEGTILVCCAKGSESIIADIKRLGIRNKVVVI